MYQYAVVDQVKTPTLRTLVKWYVVGFWTLVVAATLVGLMK